MTFPTRRAMISCSDSSAAFKISNCSGGMRPTDFTFGLHFLYLRRRRWPLLVTTVCFDESELTGLIETLDSMMLDRLGALPPPQRKDLRGLPLARNQCRDAAGPRVSPATGCEMPAPAGQTDKATGAARGSPTSWEGPSGVVAGACTGRPGG